MVGTVQSANQEPLQSKYGRLLDAYNTFDLAAREYFSDKGASSRIEPTDSPGSSTRGILGALDSFLQQNPTIARIASGVVNLFSQMLQPSQWQKPSFMGNSCDQQGGNCWNRTPSFMDRLMSGWSSQCQGWPQRSYLGMQGWGGGFSNLSFSLGKFLQLKLGRSLW